MSDLQNFWETNEGQILSIWHNALQDIASFNHYNNLIKDRELNAFSSFMVTQNFDYQIIEGALFQANSKLESLSIEDFTFTRDMLVNSGPTSSADVNILNPDFIPDDLAVQWSILIESGLGQLSNVSDVSTTVNVDNIITINGSSFQVQTAGLDDISAIEIADAGGGNMVSYNPIEIPAMEQLGGWYNDDYLPQLDNSSFSDFDTGVLASIQARFDNPNDIHPAGVSYFFEETDPNCSPSGPMGPKLGIAQERILISFEVT
ncbi:hypothetical protein [Kordiimonas pumila]|uniref:Uncharacterized protein n=1 Tax=Kordiimonas pumila TaxID=2161677 RepID=A0ABV7D7D2_9PROT|nr:hypothetical protein [Kordiimonas pumila]